MRGYPTSNGYFGYVNGEYMLFEDEGAYIDYVEELEEKEKKL